MAHQEYVVMERRHSWFDNKKRDIEWDAAALVTLHELLNGKLYQGDKLLLFLRYPESNWDNNDPNVYVYGITDSEGYEESLIARTMWEPKTVWLTSHTVMTVEDPAGRSEISLFYEKRRNSPSSR
jgi:hypothetical protein